MKSFAIFFEETVDRWSATNLGLSRSVSELPSKRPHGFWVDRHGNFLTVEPYGHEDGAEYILTKAGVDWKYYNKLHI